MANICKFTDTGAGTLIRRGNKVNVIDNLSQFEDIQDLKSILMRDREALDAKATVDRYVQSLSERPFKAYFDDGRESLAIVFPPQNPGSSLAHLSTFTVSRDGWLANVSDNVFSRILSDFPNLIWTVKADDENLAWFMKKADSCSSKDGEVLFWAGQNDKEAIELMRSFPVHGQDTFGNADPQSHLQEATRTPTTSAASVGAALGGGSRQQVRAYSTRTTNFASPTLAQATKAFKGMRSPKRSRSYATVSTTNPNPPYGKKHASNTKPSKVALIGARGYTGQELIKLINDHDYLDLQCVSSRELAGQKLEGYKRKQLTYDNLTQEDVRKMASNQEIDVWILALPNGVSMPWVQSIDEAGGSESLVVDLSADWRFSEQWTYGLPEMVERSKIAQATRISNPGCYATAAQLAILPLLPYIPDHQYPVVIGHVSSVHMQSFEPPSGFLLLTMDSS